MAAKITVAGFRSCSYFQKAANVVSALEHLHPNAVQADIFEFTDKASFLAWLPSALPLLHRVGEEGEVIKHATSPLVWENDKVYIGGCDAFLEYAREHFSGGSSSGGASKRNIKVQGVQKDDEKEKDHGFQYDLFVIGGGSGGISVAKQAAKHGANVAMADFVKPSPAGSTWGLGGTCVNVGCIPKKLFHQAALLGEAIHDAKEFGWENIGFPILDELQQQDEASTASGVAPAGMTSTTTKPSINWEKLVTAVHNHVASLNFGYRVQMREKNVKYLNELAKFVDPHTVELTDKKGRTQQVTARRFVIAVGGRPKALECPGAELAISSDDIFTLKTPPGKTLVVGASYIALECGGFLTSLGFDVTIMVRSILLRGFDQDMAERIGKYMESHGTKFLRGKIPTKLEAIEIAGQPRKIRAHFEGGFEDFDTVLAAVGRDADLKNLGLDKAGVTIEKSGKLKTNGEQTNVPHIYAVGDVLEGKLELTPTAIHAGKLLADRLFSGSKVHMDYRNVCTTVFTPLEYGTVGLSESDAIAQYGEASIEVFHSNFLPLEWTVPHRDPNDCYTKVVVNLADNNRVLGLHFLGPNAGEVVQGYGVGMKMGMTMEDIAETIGIHPTVSEEIVTLNKTKRSGENPTKTGC